MISRNKLLKSQLSSDYQYEIVENYKKVYFENLDQGFLPKRENILEIILPMFELTRKELDEETEAQLTAWETKIESFEFIKEELLDKQVNEIILHCPSHIQVLGRKRRWKKEIKTFNAKEFQAMVQFLLNSKNMDLDYSNPFCSFDFSIFQKKLRISICHKSTSPFEKTKVFIRKLHDVSLSLSSFGTKVPIKDLEELVQNKKNVLITGPTGSGKTSFIVELIKLIPKSEHTVILEDTHEIPLLTPQMSHLLSNSKSEAKSLNAYLAYALRMSPDRIILGELRSSEIIPFTLAMNTGHKGLISSVHANNAVDALYRLSLLFQIYNKNPGLSHSTILKLISTNIDFVIYLENKKVVEMIKVLGSDKDQVFYEVSA